MSFIDLFAKGQHSSMHVQLTSSVQGESGQTELFISKYCSQHFEFCRERSICRHVSLAEAAAESTWSAMVLRLKVTQVRGKLEI